MNRFAFAIAAVAVSTGALAAPEMRPGLWELTVATSVNGTARTVRAFKVTYCYTPEDVKDLRRILPEKNKECAVSDWQESGNRVSWKMSCTGKNAMSGISHVTVASETWTGMNVMTSTRDGQTMTVTSKSTARRLGECGKAP